MARQRGRTMHRTGQPAPRRAGLLAAAGPATIAKQGTPLTHVCKAGAAVPVAGGRTVARTNGTVGRAGHAETGGTCPPG
eukprot:COSAG01_NODE_17367_length_1157_cov_0.884688_2_plen_79_part_00